jgi:hypothetical protein
MINIFPTPLIFRYYLSTFKGSSMKGLNLCIIILLPAWNREYHKTYRLRRICSKHFRGVIGFMLETLLHCGVYYKSAVLEFYNNLLGVGTEKE